MLVLCINLGTVVIPKCSRSQPSRESKLLILPDPREVVGRGVRIDLKLKVLEGAVHQRLDRSDPDIAERLGSDHFGAGRCVWRLPLIGRVAATKRKVA